MGDNNPLSQCWTHNDSSEWYDDRVDSGALLECGQISRDHIHNIAKKAYCKSLGLH